MMSQVNFSEAGNKDPLTEGHREHLLSELGESGIPESVARHLIDSGHYRSVTAAEAKQAVGIAAPGWVVQFPDLSGRAPLRLNGAGSAPFIRFKPIPALAPKKGGGKAPKYLSAKNSGCRPYFSPLLSQRARDPKGTADFDITEGEKKADSACSHGYDTIGLSGVDCFRDGRAPREGILPELEAIGWEKRTVRIAFDSDAAHKPDVQDAMRRLAFALTRRGTEVLVTTIPCEIPSGPGNPTPEMWKNGLDDFIARHGAEAYRIARRLARECVREERQEGGGIRLRWIWVTEPSGHGANRTKALLAWTIFKESFAVDPNIGALHWVGTHWEILDGKPEERLARPFLHWCDAMGWNETGLGAALRQLVEELRVERRWNPPGRLAFLNGTLDTSTGEFSPGHRREDRITILHAYRYDPKAKAPRWQRFLSEALGGSKAKIRLLRAAIRWTLEPKDRTQPFPAEFCFDIGGRRGSGKGTTSEVVIALVGGTEGGAARLDMNSLDNPAALFGLIGRRMAFDPDASGHLANAGIFNAIVSNEDVQVKKLYVNEYSTRLGVVVWRFFNDQISVSGGNEEGLGRRIVPISFNNPPARRDRGLKAALQAELSGIFAWVWEMSLEDALNALANAAADEEVLQAAIDAALARNPRLRFLVAQFPEGGALEASELYRQWKLWCLAEGHHHGNKATFCAEVQKVTGAPKRVGQAKTTTYVIPPMEPFDFAAFLGLDRGGQGVDVDSEKVDVDSLKVDVDYGVGVHLAERDGRRLTESTSTQRPPNAASASGKNPVPALDLPLVDVDFSEKEKRESRRPHRGAETGPVGELGGKRFGSPVSASTPERLAPDSPEPHPPAWHLNTGTSGTEDSPKGAERESPVAAAPRPDPGPWRVVTHISGNRFVIANTSTTHVVPLEQLGEFGLSQPA